MKQWILIFAFFCTILMPFSSYAEEEGIIGSNLGLDFYSRIDDAGDGLARGIVTRRLTEKGTYRSLGCGAPWMEGEKIDSRLLDELVVGQYTRLMHMAGTKKVTLTTPALSLLSQCLVEKYNAIQKSARQDQNTLETVGNIGLYMDGDTGNSDYDIVSDITRINAIIFREKYDYTGTKNASAGAISNMLAGGTIASLFPISTTGGNSNTDSPDEDLDVLGDLTDSDTDSPLPWADVCSVGGTSGTPSGDDIFGDGFFDGIDSVLGGGPVTDGQTYTPGINSNPTDTGFGASNFGNSESNDFFHTVPCTGIFCITIDMKGGMQNALGGFANTSIESLLEKHSKMMDSISWSDLGHQKFSKNSYQPLSVGKNFAKVIAGGRIFMTEAPQQTKRLEKDDTPEKKDAIFDAAFRCAMNEAGLPGDPILANGFGGAGFVGLTDTMHVPNKTLPVTPQEMDSLAGCYSIRANQGKRESYNTLSTDLNEIQGFTDAMMNIILQIIDTDKKLDRLPTK